MHFHHYTLVRLGELLLQRHKGERILSAFSQNKNELILELEGTYLRVGCHTPQTFLVALPSYSKARKNVVNLFPDAIELRLENITVVPFERILIMHFSNQHELIFKMHGLKANIMLRRKGEIIDVFNKQKEEDWHFEEAEGPYSPELESEALETNEKAIVERLKMISPIYEKYAAKRVLSMMEQGKDFPEAFRSLLQEYKDDTYFIVKEKEKIKFYLFPPSPDLPQQRIKGVEQALQQWLKYTFQQSSYKIQFKAVDREISKPLKKYKKVYESYLKNIEQLENERNPEEIGHIIMANLHAMEANAKKVSLFDFYKDETITIKLDPKLNPQENAKRYYDKHKTRRSRLLYLKEQLEDIENKFLQAEEDYEAFRQLPHPADIEFGQMGFDPIELKNMKTFNKRFRREMKEAEVEKSPFRHFKKSGYEIFVGKNARNNDELSFKFANKNDTWLHAKDVSGSHVVIRHRAGKDLPEEVLEYAAQLAAFYSKRKTDTLVPVLYTPRKYIRKRKGDPPGMVAVDRERVIMVEPVRE
ncbi:MAG: NFACT RNA binding domain-containing protein [Bacteroidota bacterium]